MFLEELEGNFLTQVNFLYSCYMIYLTSFGLLQYGGHQILYIATRHLERLHSKFTSFLYI